MYNSFYKLVSAKILGYNSLIRIPVMVPYNTIWYCMALYYMVLYGIILYGIIWYYMVLYDIIFFLVYMCNVGIDDNSIYQSLACFWPSIYMTSHNNIFMYVYLCIYALYVYINKGVMSGIQYIYVYICFISFHLY